MPDSMNFANSQPLGYGDPNAAAYQQGGMPEWGDQYGQQMPGAYQQDMYQQGYADPMMGQQMPGYQNDMYYQGGYADPMQGYASPEMEAERAARQAQIRSSSIFGPKGMGGDMGMQQQAQAQPMAQPQRSNTPNPAAVPSPATAPQQGGQMGGFGQQADPSLQQGGMQAAPSAPQGRHSAQAMPQDPSMMAEPIYDGPPPSGGSATISLILGLLSIIFALIPPIGIILGLVSKKIAKGYFAKGGTASRAESGRVFGTVGFVFSIVMLCVMVLVAVYIAAGLYGEGNARALVIYFNNSPLGNIFRIPLPSVITS